MPINKYLEETTHRAHRASLAWLDEQWNKPDRHDHYMMQVCLMLLRVNSLLIAWED